MLARASAVPAVPPVHPADDMVVELAVAAGCEVIVTHNTRDFRGAERFGVRLVTPETFLEELRGRTWVH